MKIGSIVKPTEISNFSLSSGCQIYNKAIVIELEPFTLVSENMDMKWTSTVNKSDFEVVGEIEISKINDYFRR